MADCGRHGHQCFGYRVELEGVEGKADVSVSVATENRTKAYREIALLKKADLT